MFETVHLTLAILVGLYCLVGLIYTVYLFWGDKNDDKN